MKISNLSLVNVFEEKIAEFFGASYAVATDSCTHALELALRYTKSSSILSPRRTYISVPSLASKLNINLCWQDIDWTNYYYLTPNIVDAAPFWQRDGYIPNTFMALSFQFNKHLSLGRAGVLLLENSADAYIIKKMSYDGRLPNIPWREQDIDTVGYHYYMTPETAQLGLDKLQAAIDTEPKVWSAVDYPDISKMRVFV